MMFAKIGQSKIWESEKQKLLPSTTINKHLKFEEHIVNSKSGTSKNFSENVYRIPGWILPFNLDVLRVKFE